MSVATDPISIHLPETLRHGIEALAQREGISVEQFVTNATAEKLAAWQGLDVLRQEAALGRREDLEHFLRAVPDVEPAESDRLPDTARPA